MASSLGRQLINWTPVIIITAVIFLGYSALTKLIILPYLDTNKFIFVTSLILINALLVIILGTFAMAVLQDPGLVPPEWSQIPPPMDNVIKLQKATGPGPDQALRNHPLLRQLNERQRGTFRYCNLCCLYKPDRAHHCSKCERCVLKMDHHCGFINNCVGYGNQKVFVLFLIYALSGCMTVTVLLCKRFWLTFIYILQGKAPIYGNGLLLSGWFIVTIFSIALFGLLSYQLYLVFNGVTTLETKLTKHRMYNHGFLNNIKEVFGNNPFLWPFPTKISVSGNGCIFRMVSGRLDV